MRPDRRRSRDGGDQPLPERPSLSRRLDTSMFGADPLQIDADPWRSEADGSVPPFTPEATDEESIWNLAYPSPVRAAWEHATRLPEPTRAEKIRKYVPQAGSRGRYALLGVAVVGAAMLALLVGQVMAAWWGGSADPIAVERQKLDGAAAQAFEALWQRVDFPVLSGEAQRSWVWGPEPLASGRERYSGGVDGMRWVQYFDKGRLELTDGVAVTSGLLVREMVAGAVAIGDGAANVERRKPAAIPVAGDAGDQETPTYASFRDRASLDEDNAAEARLGAPITETLDRRGQVGTLPAEAAALAQLARVAQFETRLGHNIPDVFWRFLNQQALVYDGNSKVPDQPLFTPWETVVGLPLTEPYWVAANIDGRRRWVLTQLFERRVLTFTPDNAPEFQVEMGNTGRHYWQWRYGTDLDAMRNAAK